MKYLTGFCCAVLIIASVGVFASEKPAMDMDTNGNAVSVWQTTTFGGSIVQASVLVSGTWGSPVSISSSSTAAEPKVMVIASGNDIINAVAVWTQIENELTTLFAAMYVNEAWTNPAQVSENTEDVVTPFILRFNTNGNILLTWSSFDSMSNQYIRSSSAQIGSSNSWNTPETISGP